MEIGPGTLEIESQYSERLSNNPLYLSFEHHYCGNVAEKAKSSDNGQEHTFQPKFDDHNVMHISLQMLMTREFRGLVVSGLCALSAI